MIDEPGIKVEAKAQSNTLITLGDIVKELGELVSQLDETKVGPWLIMDFLMAIHCLELRAEELGDNNGSSTETKD